LARAFYPSPLGQSRPSRVIEAAGKGEERMVGIYRFVRADVVGVMGVEAGGLVWEGMRKRRSEWCWAAEGGERARVG